MILVDTLYINKGGGKALLEYFIQTICEKKIEKEFYFIFDERIIFSSSINLQLIRFTFLTPSELSRRKFYRESMDTFTSFYCFANVPPPYKIKLKKVYIFFHNVLLVNALNANLPILDVLYLSIKKNYIKFVNSDNYNWITQTEVVKELLKDRMGVSGKMIEVLPFFNLSKFQSCNTLIHENYNNYLYVADSSKQKNHLRLLNSWYKFTRNPENKDLILHLTLPGLGAGRLYDKINYLNSKGCNIVNNTNHSFDRVFELYQKCNYFIFPSVAESFGLPLIEAASSGCMIIASDLPYVHNVVKPSLLFNPFDENSIILSLEYSRDYTKISKSKLLVKNHVEQIIKNLTNV